MSSVLLWFQTKIDLKTKALAKICINKIMSASLLEFKKKYPNWCMEVPALLSQLGVKRKKSKNRSADNKKCRSEKPFIESSRRLKEQHLTDSSYVINTSGNNGFLVEIVRNGLSLNTLHDRDGMLELNKKNMLVNEVETENLKENKNYGEERKKKVDKRKQDNLKINSEATIEKEKLKQKKEEKKVIDPFFVTPDNNEYMTVVTNEKQIEALKKTDEIVNYMNVGDSKNTNNFHNNSISHKNKEFNNNLKHLGTNFNKRGFDKLKDGSFVCKKIPRNGKRYDKNKDGNDFKFHLQASLKEDKIADEKLHPSWEAKKKLSSLTQFTGKKIVFSDE